MSSEPKFATLGHYTANKCNHPISIYRLFPSGLKRHLPEMCIKRVPHPALTASLQQRLEGRWQPCACSRTRLTQVQDAKAPALPGIHINKSPGTHPTRHELGRERMNINSGLQQLSTQPCLWCPKLQLHKISPKILTNCVMI